MEKVRREEEWRGKETIGKRDERRDEERIRKGEEKERRDEEKDR